MSDLRGKTDAARATQAMLAALEGRPAQLQPAGERAFAIVEIAGPEDEQPIETAAELTLACLYRGGPPRAPSEQLIGAVAAFELPPGVGQACVIGETSTVRAQRQGLVARGLPKTQIAAEGYWRPGRVGGHDHVVEPDLMRVFSRGGERLRRAFR